MPNDNLVQNLRRRLPDEFSLQVLDAALQALTQSNNPLRAQHFAASYRELIGHVLVKMAPDEAVILCAWYQQDPNTQGPTRRQRALYAARGGLHDEFIKDTLKLDPASFHSELGEACKELNKRTHIRSNTVLKDPAEIEVFANEVIGALDEVFDAIDEVRGEIIRSIETHLHDEAMEVFIRETIGALDEISTHYTTDIVWTDEMQVLGIDADLIRYQVTGSVDVQLQFGSNSDLRNDMGAVLDQSFPFTCTTAAPVDNPFVFKTEMTEMKVDTREWHGEKE